MKITKTSSITNIEHTMDLDISEDQLNRIRTSDELIQNICPNLSNEEREFLITGITPEEWNEIFGSDDEGE